MFKLVAGISKFFATLLEFLTLF